MRLAYLDYMLDREKLIRTGRTVVQSVLAAVIVAVAPLLLSDSVTGAELWTAAKVAAVTTVLAYVSPNRKHPSGKPLELPRVPNGL